MMPLDDTLRSAGQRLRDTAPTPSETERAMANLNRSDADERGRRPRPGWFIAPVLALAAAAAAVAIWVLPRPVDQTITPAGSTLATEVSAAPESRRSARVVAADHDGAGGACVEVISGDVVEATGCLPGAAVAAGRGARFAGPGVSGVVRIDPGGTTATYREEPMPCFDPVAVVGDPLKDVVACTERGDVLYATLPADPAAAPRYATTARPDDAVNLVAGTAAGVSVWASAAATDADTGCVLVVVEGLVGWRETCRSAGEPSRFVAGAPDRPVLVEFDGGWRAAPLDPEAPLLANGCRAAVGTLLAGLPAGAAMTGMHCVGGAAIGRFGTVGYQSRGGDAGLTLQRDAGDGTWPSGDTSASLPCARYARTCAEFGATADLAERVLPIPSATTIAALAAALPTGRLDPIEVTSRYRAIGAVPDASALAAAIERAWRADGDLDTDIATLAAAPSPMLIGVTGIPDDAAGDQVLIVWYSPTDGGVALDAAIAIPSCRRGITNLDGEQVCV